MAYVISDLYFFNNEKSSFLNLNVFQYNEMIISKWNAKITNDDAVYIFGKFGDGTRKDIKELIKKLNGKKYLVSGNENNNLSIEDWKKCGIILIWDSNFFLKSQEKVFLFPKDNTTNLSSYSYDYICVPESFNNKAVFENNRLSLEAKYWDYTPINLNNIPEICKNMEEYLAIE